MNALRIAVHGDSHLAQIARAAARLRGFYVCSDGDGAIDLTFAAEDVYDHADLSTAKDAFDTAMIGGVASRGPLVLLSQVPPGTTRAWGAGREDIYYQVDTIIMSHAVERMYWPGRIIVGCVDPEAPLPIAYQAYLAAHECPVLKMSYESAELAKCAINYVLTAQIKAARDIEAAALLIGAEYTDVRLALHTDMRIGHHAYLRPGRPNAHLERDVFTIKSLIGKS